MFEVVQKKKSFIPPAPQKKETPKTFTPPPLPAQPATKQQSNESVAIKPYSSEARDSLQKKVLENMEVALHRKSALETIQRKCAVCEREDRIQRKEDGETETEKSPFEIAASGFSGAPTRLPHLETIQRSFGRDMSHVQAFIGGRARAASRRLGATAYTAGKRIAFEAQPSLELAAHEAAHVVQQQSLKVQLKGGVGEVGDEYERHADAVANLVVQGKSAVSLLGEYGGDDGVDVQEKSSEIVQNKCSECEATEQPIPAQSYTIAQVNPEQLSKECQQAILEQAQKRGLVTIAAGGFVATQAGVELTKKTAIRGVVGTVIPVVGEAIGIVTLFHVIIEFFGVPEGCHGQPGFIPTPEPGPTPKQNPTLTGIGESIIRAIEGFKNQLPDVTEVPATAPTDADKFWDSVVKRFRENYRQLYTIEEIQAIQRLVGANPNGDYGKETAQRVFDWQHKFGTGLIDGIVGPETFSDMFPGQIPSGLQQNSSSSTATDDAPTESKPAPTTGRLPSQSTPIEESRRSIEKSRRSVEESRRSIEESRLSIAESQRSFEESQRQLREAQEQAQKYATFDELLNKEDELTNKFAQHWPEENSMFLLRIIRGTTARLYETELQLPQGSVEFDQGNIPNGDNDKLNWDMFNRIFGMILSNLEKLLELKPEIVAQIDGVGIFYEPAKYPESLSRAATLGQETASRQTSPSPSNSSTSSTSSSSSLPVNSDSIPVSGETPIPINEVDGLRFVLQSLPAEIKVKLGGEENYLPLENYYPQLVNIAIVLQELTPQELASVQPLNLKGVFGNKIADAIESFKQLLSRLLQNKEQRKPNVCGPDVTSPLINTLSKVRNTFDGWSWKEKRQACTSLIEIPGGRVAWDIEAFYDKEWLSSHLPGVCATPGDGKCTTSVEVKNPSNGQGQCYYAGSVNYVVFGLMWKLCFNATFEPQRLIIFSNPLSSLAVYFHKGPIPGIRPSAGNFTPSIAWTNAGYQGWPSGGSTPAGDRPKCSPSCPQPVTGEFQVHWGSGSPRGSSSEPF